MKKNLLFLALLVGLNNVKGQMVMNGGQVVVRAGAYIYLEGSTPSAITISNTNGGFVLNDANSRLRWHIYSNYGNYTVPFYYSSTYMPLSFSTSLAQGGGYVDLGTYATPTWKNSDYLPPGVTNVNHNGIDNSAHLVDRFWLIDAGDYITKPTLSNLSFTYLDGEWNAPGNSINEPLLKGQRWNSALLKWSDFAPSGTANTVANTVTLSSVLPADLFQWWTLVDAAYPLPVRLLSFKAWLKEKKVFLDWSTNLELNTKEFVVERSSDRIRFDPIDTVVAIGTSNTLTNYSSIDANPLLGTSYYRLKMMDMDGKFSYSTIAVIVNQPAEIMIYPNPASDKIFINPGDSKIRSYILFDAAGKMVKSAPVNNLQFAIDVSGLAQGSYLLQLQTGTGSKTFPFIKD